MEFEHLNQPDFDRERDGAFDEIMENEPMHVPTYVLRRAYNEGYKQCLRDWSLWKDGVQHIGCMQRDIKEIIAEVDKIDGENA